MTVTRVCRDYLFYNRWGFKKVNVYLNLMILFVAIGAWHGTNLYWISWGALHGLGFCAYLYYRNNKDRFAFAHERMRPVFHELAARISTYVFVCLCWYLASKIALFLLGRHIP